MRLLTLFIVALASMSLVPGTASARDKVRLVLLGDTTLFGYNVPLEEGLPQRLASALSRPDRRVEIVKSPNLDTTKSAVVWLITKSAKAVLANPEGAALVLSVGYWDCGVMSLEQTRANLAKVMAAFDAADIPILLVEVQPRTFCGAEYNATYSAIFLGLAEEFGAHLYTDLTPPPPDERPEGVNFITRPVPFDDVLAHVEKLLDRVDD